MYNIEITLQIRRSYDEAKARPDCKSSCDMQQVATSAATAALELSHYDWCMISPVPHGGDS